MMGRKGDDFVVGNAERERMYHINEIEDMMISDNRKKAESTLSKIKEWVKNQGHETVLDNEIHAVLVVPIKADFGQYYMQIILDHNNIRIAAVLDFDYRNYIRIDKIVSEINSNKKNVHLGYAHAYIEDIDHELIISYMFFFDYSDPIMEFNPDKHFAKYWDSIADIVARYYKDIKEVNVGRSESGKTRGSIMDKFFDAIKNDGDFDLSPMENDRSPLDTFLLSLDLDSDDDEDSGYNLPND